MKYVKSVQAALRATAPFVAIPVEGKVPVCIRAKLLKGALKGVSIHSVKIITEGEARWLHIQGRADGGVRTSCKMVATSIRDHNVFCAMREWTIKEREKRIKVINQGVLNSAERKALKLKEAQAKEEKYRTAELIAAKREEQEILSSAKSRVLPEITPVGPEERESIVAQYREFRASCPNRKRGAVIRWKLEKLREQVAKMTVWKREYKEVESSTPMSLWHRKRRKCVAVTKVLRRKTGALEYAALTYQIGQLETQYKALYPARHVASDYVNEGRGYWIDSFIAKRPKAKTYSVPWTWERPEHEDSLQTLARRLQAARDNIRALTPPPDEDEEELPIAA